MADKIHVKGYSDHVKQWAGFKTLYVEKRGSDAGRSGKAIPRTTNDDVKKLATYWDNELHREIMRNVFANDRSPSNIKEWTDSKAKIDKHMATADGSSLYAHNEWFWDTATLRLALYLESRKAIPSSTDLMIDAVTETVTEHAQAAKDLAKSAAGAVADAGKDLVSALKTGALILGGVVGAAIVLPPVIRAFRDKRSES